MHTKSIRFLNATLGGIILTTAPSLVADPSDHEMALCGKLENLVQDRQIGMRLETRADGFVLRLQSQDAVSQSLAKSFAVEVMKQHDLTADVPKTNGYGLPEE